MITTIKFIIATAIISFCIAVIIGGSIYKVLNKKYDDRVGYLESKVEMLEERFFRLEDMYLEHIGKYH